MNLQSFTGPILRNKHRLRPYESAIDIAKLCSSLLPEQHLFVTALYLHPKAGPNQEINSLAETL